ncbi:hypothetical protein MSAN_01547200 [Mycena sanguinolenta]|uniref:F-box domain-containing protein n=1 Tax=Mycena sanguinolenta TaxID=230812 RepID=A0A8H6Y831_9AGAR|nr:hypothetical protein MSAN_01547200 [Mycena sanguinolenta]
MPFETLGEDVLLKIFCFCDISTVLAVSVINKPLRRIALSKQLWLSLVLDPGFRDALDLPPPDRDQLECLSTKELIAVVQNAVAEPVWGESSSSSSVTMTRFQIPLDDMEDCPEAWLLSGARYILLHSTTQHTLCIYDVWSARRVWERPVQARTLCQVDLVPGGAVTRIFFVQTVDHPNTCTLHVEEVDLTTGASHELFNLSLGSTIFEVKPCAIAGDFLLGTVLHSTQTLILINWRASIFVSLGRASLCCIPISSLSILRFCPDAQLIPGHILSTYKEISPPHAHFLAVTPLGAFSDRWQPLTEDDTVLAAQLESGYAHGTIPIKNITTLERLKYNHWSLTPNFVTATPDALHAGAYNISVYGLQISKRPPRPATLLGRIGNLITGTARRGKASREPAQALLLYRFTPEQGQASSKLRLVSERRVSNLLQVYCHRAIPMPSGNSISVVYRQCRQRTGADVA